MNIGMKRILGPLLLAVLIAVFLPQASLAAGTAAGTSVVNNASVDYYVNSQHQPVMTTSVSFVVDDKVVFTIAANDGALVGVLPGGTAALPFTVTNNGNNTHDFALLATQVTGTVVPTFVVADNTNGTLTNLKTSGTGTVYIDELAPNASLVIYIVVTPPSSATNGLLANYSLTAIAHQGGATNSLGALTTNTAGNKNQDSTQLNTMYIVLADGAGNGAGDANYDGKYVQNGNNGFRVTSAALNMTKTSMVYWDPVNNTTSPRAIPGANLIYTLTVTNTGSAPTTTLTISDTLPGTLAFLIYNDGVTSCAAGQALVKIGAGAAACTGAPNVTAAGQTLSVQNLNVDQAGGPNPTITVKYMATVQ